ncbi:MAG TPA: maleylpyruvate isomerase N-terminal domain-containing protein [Streptosporangiaceae bacterium]|jgi:hypothetical protein
MVICELAAQFTAEAWDAATPCPEWRAVDLAAHLRCVADDYHEYLDDAPASRLARLMASSTSPERLARKLARQNAAELAALADGTGPEHILAFAISARAYAQRIVAAWDQPHHRYRDVPVTAGGMLGAACAEWHLHAWDLARTLGKGYRPADPDVLAAGWQAGMPHLPLGIPLAVTTCGAGPETGFLSAPPPAVDAGGGPAEPDAGGAWFALLRASGRLA